MSLLKNSVVLKADSYYLLRRPLQPVNEIFALNEQLKTDASLLWQCISKRFTDPLLNEAIYIASPDLHQEFDKLMHDDTADKNKMALSLYKYFIRMSTRCTPYGLFAGCSTGMLGQHTNITYKDALFRKESRLDMMYVCELATYILQQPAVKTNSIYFPNTSLYSIGDTYRYIEYSYADKKRNYILSSFKHSPYLAFVLEKTTRGLSYADIVSAITLFDDSIAVEEAADFIDHMIGQQILVSEFEPSITGDLYFSSLTEKLSGIVSKELSGTLKDLHTYISNGGIDNFKKAHQLINEKLLQTSSKDLVQTDLFFMPSGNTLHQEITETIVHQLSALFRFTEIAQSPELNVFRKNFLSRFGDQEVSLLLALDTESGLGYASEQGKNDFLPLLEGIAPAAYEVKKTAQWNALCKLANDIFQRSKQSASRIAELTDDDLATFEEPAKLAAAIPGSLSVFGTLLASSSDSIDTGNFQFLLHSCNGPSSAIMLARFCHGDAVLLEKVKQGLERDETDGEDAVYAEIVHLPEARVGNILLRPRLRTYEIPFLGRSSAEFAYQIPLQDIMVSVRNGKIVLRSRRLNKVVIPRISSAHNFSTGLPIYRFLCDLQIEGMYLPFNWHWQHLAEAAHLPRVVYKNIIVSKATWKVQPADIENSASGEKGMAALAAFLEQKRIPRHICLKEHDNELLLDLHAQPALQILLQHLKKKGTAYLTEFLSTPDQCFIKGTGDEVYANEIIIPLFNPLFNRLQEEQDVVNPSQVKRSFLPGDEWLYFKIYGGTKTIDTILCSKIQPLVSELLANNHITQWYFIRYANPDHHARVRLRIGSNRSQSMFNVINRFQEILQPELSQHLLHKMQLDTYEREIERYGADNIEDSEALFFYDSQAIINALHVLEGELGETYRWLLAFKSVDMLLDDFRLTLPEKIDLVKKLATSFYQEFNGEKSLTLQLNNKYRKESKQIRFIMNLSGDEGTGLSDCINEFRERSIHLKPVINRILNRYGCKLPFSSKGLLVLSSYIHMSMNRFFLAKARLHELTIYYLLHKYYCCFSKIGVGAHATE